MDILEKSLNLIDDIINDKEVKNLDFYENMLTMMSSLFNNSFIGIYFLENTDYILKAAIKNNILSKKDCKIPTEFIEKLLANDKKALKLQTKNNDYLFKNNILVKLAIRNSVFGFCILSKDSIVKDEETAFEALVNLLSYKIKDFELNEVFKIQVKAMQEAIIEKEGAYEVIKKQHKKLQELDKTKNLFIANISHELRTPLNAIIGFSQALDSKIFGELNEKQAEYIKDIQISSLHLLGMINEILDISKLEANAMKFNPTELNSTLIIQEVINILEPLYKNKNIEIVFNNNFNFNIKADYQKFQQILYNLLSNAIKFTPKDGKIEIIQSENKKDYTLKIKDNGIGIDKKYHNKIFKKFVHINNESSHGQHSTGLGLTITKELVKLHNGKIILESELNKGTTFTMEFKNIII